MGLNSSNMEHMRKFKNIVGRQHSSLKRRWLSLRDPENAKNAKKRPGLRSSVKRKDSACKIANTFDKTGLTPVHHAAQVGDAHKLEELIASGGHIDVLSIASNGRTPPVVYAAMNGHTQCVEVLLAAGADPNITDEWGNSALFKSASYNYIDCVETLLRYGASSTLSNKWGAVPIQIASLQGYIKIVELLLQNGAELRSDIDGNFGDTSLPHPVVAVATRCHLDCLKMLLNSETTIDASQLESALTMAIYYFLCACAGYQYTTSNATIAERFECIKLLVANGAEITLEHVKMTCYHHFIPVLNLKAYVQMLKFVLRAMKFDSLDPNWDNTMMVIFGHVTRLGKYKWELLQLICSIGFTPGIDLLDGLAFTLTETEMEELQNLRTNPRSLTDLCRQTVRKHASSNVPCLLNSLNIPPRLRDIVLVQ